jgi:hypothetical protein
MSGVSAASQNGQQSTPSSTATAIVAEEATNSTFLNFKAIELLACAKAFLLAISSAMQTLPEGQVAEFLRLLTLDALESITLVDSTRDLEQKSCADSEEGGKSRVTEGIKALVELYCCTLENVNIVGTNSIQAGKAVRQLLVQIVTPQLVHLIDFVTLPNVTEDNTPMVLETREKMGAALDAPHKRAAPSKKALQDNSLLRTWSLTFFLRLYITTQSLYRECVSLMPPKAAKKAREAFDTPLVDILKGDITDIVRRYSEASFFAGVGKGTVKVSNFLAGIDRKQDSQELVSCPSLSNLLDCIVLQSLAQLSGHSEAVGFLVNSYKLGNAVSNGTVKTEDQGPQSNGVSNEDLIAADERLGIQKLLQKLLKELKKESQKLVKILLREVGWKGGNTAVLTTGLSNFGSQGLVNSCSTERPSKVELRADFSSQQASEQTWHLVEATLTADTLPIQRWKHLCMSFDIWAKFAAEEDLKNFVVFLFSSSVMGPPNSIASEEQNEVPKTTSQDDKRKQISDFLLCNALFYEEEVNL